jgi:DNA-binding FadR family transcriptional regulator
MPIQTIESQRLYRQIAEQLSQLIANGELVEGERLPSERELASQLGVSRPSVREALIALEVAGKVEVRVGSGIFVARRRPVAAADPTTEGQGPFELLRARCLFEGEVAFEAARAATPVQLDAVRSALDEMRRRQHQRRDLEAADRDFHLGIAKGTQNSAIVSIVQDLWDRGRGDIWKKMEDHFQTPELRAATLRDHQAIVEALVARDARAARAAMRRHLRRVDQEFSRSWEQLRSHNERGAALSLSSRSEAGRPSGRLRSK